MGVCGLWCASEQLLRVAGERRIRVHTLALPVANTLPEVLYAADQQCIVGLLSKMGELLQQAGAGQGLISTGITKWTSFSIRLYFLMLISNSNNLFTYNGVFKLIN